MPAVIPAVIRTVRQTLRSLEGVTIHYDPPATTAVEGSFMPTDSVNLSAPVADYVQRSCPEGLFQHQHQAITRVLQKQNTVVATRTSSGKSLIYSLPVLNSLCTDPHATALFIYPQKALANDQLLKLQNAIAEIGPLAERLAGNPYLCSRYDGATPQDRRQAIRQSARIIITNPDMLHFALLQFHNRHWSRFFSHLQHVVIDECHEYRGIFGTNVAFILRRLRQVCARHAASPVFVATSATIHEPQQHLESLTGAPFSCVGPEQDGSRQGVRKFWMVSGQEHFYDFGRSLAMRLAEEGLTVLAFCPGRVAAERMMARVQSANGDELSHVRVYRSGLSAAEREEIEDGLRDRSVRLVFSTNALELGIDIGAVDVVLCIGLPASMMSLWQRAGRAGRSGKEGAVIFIPAESPIDTHYAAHPQELFSRDNEPLVLNTGNRRVVCHHYACAASEMDGDEEAVNTEILGPETESVRRLRTAGQLDLDVFYSSTPHMQLNIRSIGEGSYQLEHAGVIIGEIDEPHLLREACRNAIYRHGGRGYRVRDVLRGRRKIILDREYSWNETTAYIQKRIRLKRRQSIADYAAVQVATVALDVTEFLVNVVEKDRFGKTIQQWNGSGGMPSHPLPTVGTMLLLRQPVWERLVSQLTLPHARAALQACERLLCSLFPTISGPCDRQDYSSASEVTSDEQAAIYLYDMVYDGADLTTAAFDRMAQLVGHSIERLQTCACDTDAGCFRCIANPHYPEQASRQCTLTVLTAIQQLLSETPHSIVQLQDRGEMLFDSLSNASSVCPVCAAKTSHRDRFCSNCGQKLEE